MNQMQRNYKDREQKRQFRYAYVLKTGFNYSPLAPYCERVISAVEGIGDHVDNVKDQLEESLSNFDDEKDVLIPVGNAYINVLAGMILHRKLAEKKSLKQISFAMGIWSEGSYTFWMVYSDKDMEAYEIIQ